MKNYKLSVLVILIGFFSCSRFVTPPEPPVPDASIKMKWINNSWHRQETSSYLWRDGHRVTKGRKAVWVDGHWVPSLKGLRYVPGHWR